MPLRPPAGFISANYDPLRNPDAPTGVTASAGDAQATVSFTAPANVGGSAISAYYAVSNPGQITASGASSPVTVTGLTNGTAYTFQVWALNTFGPGAFSAASGSVSPSAPTAIFNTGYPISGSFTTASIQSRNISTLGNSTTFGNLTVGRVNCGACGSSTRGVFAGGGTPSGSNVMDYVTYSSLSNAVDFGDLTFGQFTAAFSNSVTGIVTNAYIYTNSFTIATTGNATSFGGNIANTVPPNYGQCALASPTRGVFGGGDSTTYQGFMYYTTIASSGTWATFGQLTQGRRYPATGGSSTRGIFMGGQDTSSGDIYNIIDYITIASDGNATDFGDLTQTVNASGGASSQTRTLRIGGATAASTNVIDYITTASTGNAVDFGDTVEVSQMVRGTSNAHGGLS